MPRFSDVTTAEGLAETIHPETRTAVVICALGLEARAVSHHLTNIGEAISKTDIIYECGSFEGRVLWRIALAECGAGNVGAAQVVLDAYYHFEPDAILFVGVAGGLKDVDLGDVVASSKVYGYHAGKAEDDFQVRPVVEWPSIALEQRARIVRRYDAWKDRIIADDGFSVTEIEGHVAPIAAGEQVVVSKTSPTYKLVREHYGDAVCVEMEGYGFLSAVRVARTPALVVRGISDLCEGKSKRDGEGWQPRAAAHAAAFGFEVLSHFVPPPRLFPSKPPSSPGSDDTGESSPGTSGPRPPSPSLEELIAALSAPALGLLSRTVSQEAWIPRDAETQIERSVTNEDSRLVCVLGPPGSGKTALLARFSERCTSERIPILAIKADLTSIDVPFEDSLRNQTGLDISVLNAIASVALKSRVIVVLDQLDALASLVDLQSDRLNQVLRFIDHCLSIENVWVVCSCRDFEFRHDVRFTVLEPAVVNLDVPSWNLVVPQLERHGIESSDTWPESFHEILRTPQHLAVFLQLFQETGSVEVFRNYQQMLDDLWSRCINTPGRRSLVYRLTEYLTERESLWAPMAAFEDDTAIIEQLNAVGVLAVEGPQVGFRHQTLLEHARARLFAKSDESLCEHVLQRQNAILVRPTIWSVLGYLRDAETEKYESELTALFRSDLRLHVRYLLIDFLGQLPAPSEIEIVELAKRLKVDGDRERVLIATRGNSAWFDEFKVAQFPVAMQWPVESAWPMVSVISQAWSFARDDCLSLINEQWMSQPEKDQLTVRSLMELDSWDESSVEMVCLLVRRAESGRQWWVEQLAGQISADKPSLAPRVVCEDLQRRLDDDASRSPLETSNEWYDIAAISEAAPAEFLDATWNWFVDVAVRFHDQQASSVVRLYNGWASVLETDQKLAQPVVEAIRTSVEQTAQLDAPKFLEVTRGSWSVENMVVQSMVAQGLKFAAQSDSTTGLQFLCGDPRRFNLGNYRFGDQATSISLIEALAPHLTSSDLHTLEQTIIGWSKYWPGQHLSDDQKIWDREARLRLLRAIPESLMTPETSAFAQSEEQELPGWKDGGHGGVRSGFVREIPPLTKEQMLAADDDAIVAALSGPFDGDRGPSEWLEDEGGLVCRGGARAAARELSELAKSEPARVIPILYRLISEGKEQPVADVLHRLDDSPLSNDDVYKLVEELSSDREPSEEFRSNAAYLMYRRCETGKGLPDDVCTLIESWLALPWDASYRVVAESDDESAKEPDGAIIWSGSGGVINADRSFWPLMCVTHGYLMRQPADTERWYKILEDHLARDISRLTWQSYCRELRWITLKGADRKRGAAIISAMFSQYPFVRRCEEGAQLVGMISYALPEAFVRQYLDDLWSNRTALTAQVAGELLTLLALRDKEHQWAVNLLDERLDDVVDGNEEFAEFFLCGVAYTAARMWEEPSVRAGAVESLGRISPVCTERIASAFGTVFWASNDFADDENTENLLNVIANNPCVIHPEFVSDLVNVLASLCRFQQRRVYEVTRIIVDTFGNQIGDLRTSLYGAGTHLVNIAMTLQRFEETRSDGLNLLEDLMRLGIGEAFSILDDIDIRPSTTRRTQQPRRRRRRRKG